MERLVGCRMTAAVYVFPEVRLVVAPPVHAALADKPSVSGNNDETKFFLNCFRAVKLQIIIHQYALSDRAYDRDRRKQSFIISVHLENTKLRIKATLTIADYLEYTGLKKRASHADAGDSVRTMPGPRRLSAL